MGKETAKEKEFILKALAPNMIPKQEKDNIEFYHPECFKKAHPRSGRYTEADMQFCKYIKTGFGENIKEHMWVKVLSVTSEGVHGEVANMPVNPESPCYGQKVFIKYKEIEDVR